jgi:hypothetical protein
MIEADTPTLEVLQWLAVPPEQRDRAARAMLQSFARASRRIDLEQLAEALQARRDELSALALDTAGLRTQVYQLVRGCAR